MRAGFAIGLRLALQRFRAWLAGEDGGEILTEAGEPLMLEE